MSVTEYATCTIEAMSAVHNGPEWLTLSVLCPAMVVEGAYAPAKLVDCIWLWGLAVALASNLQGHSGGCQDRSNM